VRPETRVGRGREDGASGDLAWVVPRPAEPARQNVACPPELAACGRAAEPILFDADLEANMRQ